MKHLFIINPNAGHGKGKKLIPVIDEIANRLNLDFKMEITTGPKDATNFVVAHILSQNKAGLPENQLRVYAIGGDGTANEVLQGVVGHDVEFAVLPGGTGNDFVRTITGDHKFSNHTLEQLIEDTIAGVCCPINSATINDMHFMNIASIGIDAITNYNMEHTTKNIPWLPAKVAYVVSALTTLIKDRNINVEMTIDGVVLKQRIIMAAISNGRFYGGGIIPSAKAHPSDGILDLCLVSAASQLRVLGLLPKYISGKHAGEKEVSFYRLTSLFIKCEKEIIINVDGESIVAKDIAITLDSQMLNLIVPKWSPLTLFEV